MNENRSGQNLGKSVLFLILVVLLVMVAYNFAFGGPKIEEEPFTKVIALAKKMR